MTGEPINRDERTAIAEHAFGRADAVVRSEPLFGGSINAVERLTLDDGSDVILRVAPSEADVASAPGWVTVHGLRREHVVLDLLRRDAGLVSLLPITVAKDSGRTVVDRDWVIHEPARGNQVSTLPRRVRPSVEDPVWRACGDVVGAWHGVTADIFGPPSDGATFATFTDLVRADVDGLLIDAARMGLDRDAFTRLRERVEAQADNLDGVTRPRLIHSDLDLSHVFVEPAGDDELRVTTVIDFEFARFTDASNEKLFTTLLWNSRYEPVTTAMIEAAVAMFAAGHERSRARIAAGIWLGWSATLLAWQGAHDEARHIASLISSTLDPHR